MKTFTQSARFLLLFFAALFLPFSVAAQPVLSVSPTSVSVQVNAGANAPSQSVQISNGGNGALKWSAQESSNWLSVSPTAGVNGDNLTLTFQTSGFAAGQYQASVHIDSNAGPRDVSVHVTIATGIGTAPTPPSSSSVDVSVSATTVSPGSSVTVSFSGIANPTSTDWIVLAQAGASLQMYQDWKYASSCTHTPGTAKASGSCAFTAPSTAGNYEFRLFANNVLTLLDSTSLTVTTSAPAALSPPPSTGYGPRSSITCPSGAVDIWPGVSLQTMVDMYPGNTTFCVRAGVHYLRSAITPKTGDTFVGEYGAVLDGSGWATSDETQAAFRGHNQDIDYVTIRNLVIRNMPQRGIHAYYWMSDHWTIEYNEIAANRNVGIVFPTYALIRNNYIHHNTYSGYLAPYAHYSTVDSNEIAYNGREQKVMESAGVTFRNNFVHHNAGTGIWYDSGNTGALVEGNRVEDNGLIGIFYEISSDGIIRNNTIRRNGEAGVMLSVSKNVQIYSNLLDSNFRGITYFLNCPSVGGPSNFDLTNNTAHDNTITVGPQSGAFASVLSYAGCTTTQAAAYLNGSKNLTFSRNTYRVPALSGWYWVWDRPQSWTAWHALGHDVTGTASQ